jgi:hypothetical protein
VKPDPLPKLREDLATALLGAWSLTSREDYDAQGRRRIDPYLGADPLGLLFFSPTHFAAQFMKRDRDTEQAPGTPAAASVTGANNTSAANGYDAYFGTYRVDASSGRVVVRLDAALTQANVGQEFTREIRVEGSRLFIRLETGTPDGTPITRTLVFERV